MIAQKESVDLFSLVRELLEPFNLSFFEIKKEPLADYEIDMVTEIHPQHSKTFIMLLLQKVYDGEIKNNARSYSKK